MSPWQFHETNATMTSKIIKLTNQDPKKNSHQNAFVDQAVCNTMPVGKFCQMIGERITKSCHEPLRVHQLQGAGMRKYMMNDGPTNDSIIPLYLPFCKIPKHHFEKFWNSSYPRKNSTLLGAQALNAIFFGQLLWRKDPIRDDLGWRKVGMGSSTPSTPLEKIVYEKIFRGDGYARAKCCWLLPMWAGSNKPFMRGKTPSATLICGRSCED